MCSEPSRPFYLQFFAMHKHKKERSQSKFSRKKIEESCSRPDCATHLIRAIMAPIDDRRRATPWRSFGLDFGLTDHAPEVRWPGQADWSGST